MAAYWIAHVTIQDMAQYEKYMQLAPAAFQKYGAKFLARGGQALNPEGKIFERHVLIEFPDLATAQACYESEEYRLARNARADCADVMISIVEA
ncbi:DUF1330 domain-containing protein [Acinetobacter qingfengensis]|uniref:DUF1330 domain-containing protein n=1 Tax=Acinetobacter qingfengensis TaxID=1262585 RepID=A0A1E7RD85_9GAMM|nr:DUF1330 domain-containing protein [Acinetobacter qingfengensis]KAA8735366.1 DUF1330 domain-containing protein [Acinetobacter qingfengensis]OEY97308.1 hypothetical protein BJI46_10510 [Acinetobacter qingfengensis]